MTTRDDVNIWDEYKSDHIDRMKQSLTSILTEDDSFISTKSDYVIYAAIDLMNLVYTREFSSNSTTSRIVCRIDHYTQLICSGTLLMSKYVKRLLQVRSII